MLEYDYNYLLYLQTKSTLPLGTTSFNNFVNSASEGCNANARIAVPTSIIILH